MLIKSLMIQQLMEIYRCIIVLEFFINHSSHKMLKELFQWKNVKKISSFLHKFLRHYQQQVLIVTNILIKSQISLTLCRIYPQLARNFMLREVPQHPRIIFFCNFFLELFLQNDFFMMIIIDMMLTFFWEFAFTKYIQV